MPATFRINRVDLSVALLLAAVLTAAWTLRSWPDLSHFRLPDTDDGMRLQQVRDWLAGQPFGDLAQHRLGPDGTEMHWSRIGDLLPAAVIACLTPLFGRFAAELAALVVVPAALFAIAIALTSAIARRLGSSGPIAAVIAALAYPATTLFMPGRIDHHALQLILVLVSVRALLASDSRGAGLVIGVATGISLAIGLETAPLMAAIGIAVGIGWIRGENHRLTGYAVALALSLGIAALGLRTSGWSWSACDGFDRDLWRAAQIVSLAPLILIALGYAVSAPLGRSISAVAVSLGVGGAALLVAPACANPYGAVDPLIAKLWLQHVAEAQPLLKAPLSDAIGYGGLSLAGLAATAWRAGRTRSSGWWMLGGLQAVAILVSLIQLRGAYFSAVLGAPALAMMIAEARARGALPVVAAWLVSAGLVYPLAGALALPKGNAGQMAGPDCTGAAATMRVRSLPGGRLIAPTDLSAFVLPGSRLTVIAGPYHRNGAGNRAMYDFFLGSPESAQTIARLVSINYVAVCASSFEELGPVADDPHRMIGELRRGAAPDWLQRISGPGEPVTVFQVRDGARKSR